MSKHPKTWRFLDTGPRTGADNMALDAMLLELGGLNPLPTLRFLQFQPRVALVGYHQAVDQEIRVDYCRESRIDINRRITGGGAIYFDPSQLGWEVAAGKNMGLPPRPEALYAFLLQAAAETLKTLGLEAEFRPRNDIEVKGRKIVGSGGCETSRAIFFQGTLLVQNEVELMMRALRVPVEKLSRHEIETVADRVTFLNLEREKKGLEALDPAEIKELFKKNFARALGIELVREGLSPEEQKWFDAHRDYFHSDAWVHKVTYPPESQGVLKGVYSNDDGLVRTLAAVNLKENRVRSLVISGNFFAHPQGAVFDLETRFRNVNFKPDTFKRIFRDFMAERPELRIEGFGAHELEKSILALFERRELLQAGVPIEKINRVFTVKPDGTSVGELFAQAREWKYLLLPYCSKGLLCPFRHEDSCSQCGQCLIGDAYLAGAGLGMIPVTITSYENLEEWWGKLKGMGEKGYIGSCCEAFFTKHGSDFAGSGLAAILVDIDSTTCYDLGRATQAHDGEFQNQTVFDLRLMQTVLDIVKSPEKQQQLVSG